MDLEPFGAPGRERNIEKGTRDRDDTQTDWRRYSPKIARVASGAKRSTASRESPFSRQIEA